jgi:hypothetical protein
MPHSAIAPAGVDEKKSKASASEPKREPILINLNLDKVKGIHPSIRLALEELNIPPLKLPSKLAYGLDRECLSLLPRKPPIIFRNTQLWCIGNLRSYQIAKYFLDAKAQLHCIELFNLSDEKIVDDFLTEFFYDPAIFGIHASDLEIVVQAARHAIQAGRWKSPTMAVEDYFGKLYCVDKRKFKATLSNPPPVAPTMGIESAALQEVDGAPQDV